MIPTIARFAAESTGSGPFNSKSFMVGFAMFGAALGLGMIGQAYMNALGRNPEAGKAASQIIIIAAMVELTALLAIVGTILIK